MIRVELPAEGLTPAEQYGLDTLLDLSGLLQVEDRSAAVVALHLTSDPTPMAQLLKGITGGTVTDGAVRLPRELLTHVTAIAGSAVEQGTDRADRHGRVPADANPLVEWGVERVPIVSQWARSLRILVQQAAGMRPVRYLVPWPGGKRWAAAFTHDVDVVTGWPVFTSLRLLELLRSGQVSRAGRVALAAAGSALRAPAWDGVRGVLGAEEAHGVRSTWFFLCGRRTFKTWRSGDVTYAIRSRAARRIVAAVASAGNELAVHGSFATSTRDGAFADERATLLSVSGGTRAAGGVRQHFLKMRPGATQTRMRQAGFTYDATYGFSDRNGFRLGVADVVQGWDARANTTTGLDEVPLHWMDRAQSKYQGIENPDVWIDDAVDLAERCRAVGGLWVGLWHPNLTEPLGFPDAPAAYAELLQRIVDDPNPPAVETLGKLLEWRRRRRGARARRVGANGAVEWVDLPAPLEDQEGKAIA
ncbi:MAG TPA: hypothetical protein VJN62_13050 [Gemmatimonadales bacterium]|nr:hypothetical protein [Gemmatimonadales bacterium]